MRHKLFPLLIVVLAVFVETQPSLAGTVELADNRASMIEHTASGDVTVLIDATDVASLPYKDFYCWGGDVHQPPRTLVTGIHITPKDGDDFLIPLSAYSDLGEPHRVTFEQTSSGYALKVRGGDAAGAYEALMQFDKHGWLTKRRVRSGEFPQEVWQETKYSYNTLNN